MATTTARPTSLAHPRVAHGIDLDAIERAVVQAERHTTGEIRVALARFYFWGDVQRAAARAFERLGMRRTHDRNGVLIFVAPWRRRFAILGDTAVDQRVAPGFWRAIADAMAAALRGGDATGGLVRAIAAVGEELARHFPAPVNEGANPNELPDAVG